MWPVISSALWQIYFLFVRFNSWLLLIVVITDVTYCSVIIDHATVNDIKMEDIFVDESGCNTSHQKQKL